MTDETLTASRPAESGRIPVVFLAAATMLGGAILLAFSIGAYPVGPSELAAFVWTRLGGEGATLTPAAETVILSIRGPRVLVAVAAGAALASAGAAYQGLFRNPLVSPDILGVSSGAALGAVLGIVLSLPVAGIQALAFAGGLAAVFIVYALGTALSRGDPLLVLVLCGVTLGALLGSGVALLKVLADPYNQLPAITFWLLGSFSAVGTSDLLALLPALALGLTTLFLLRWRLNVMTLGEEEARALGVETGRVRFATVVAATLMTASAVAVAGIVGWVGLIIPHAARFLVGPGFGRLLPMSALMGAVFLLVVDTLARTVARIEIPLGVLTALLGTPAFLWLLATRRQGW